MNISKPLFISLVLFLSAISYSFACTISDNSMNAVGLVQTIDSQAFGSGVVVGVDKVLTAYHVVEGYDEVIVSWGGISSTGFVTKYNESKDLALIETKTFFINPVSLAKSNPKEGDNSWSIGYPLAGSLVATEGFILEYDGQDLVTTASANYGTSGGALVTCSDEGDSLVGMIKAFGAIQHEGELVRLDNYSSSATIEDINSFLKEERI